MGIRVPKQQKSQAMLSSSTLMFLARMSSQTYLQTKGTHRLVSKIVGEQFSFIPGVTRSKA